MRIKSLVVDNLRAVRRAEMHDLSDAIVIAGPNGCGKSSIFDAIRLIKSAYGQYQQNEFASWFNEFQIDIQKLQSDASRIMNDPTQPLLIRVEFELADREREYLANNGRKIYQGLKWTSIMRQHAAEGNEVVIHPSMAQDQGKIVDEQARILDEKLQVALKQPSYVAQLTMNPGESPRVEKSAVLELIFQLYKPEHIGIIDYHSATRSYGRERIAHVSLQVQDTSNRDAQHALYNTSNKYQGIKSEMGSSFVRELLAERAGVKIDKESNLQATLDELFKTFFPGKDFMGAIPTADGGLTFPVQLEGGSRHDIDELSSGEKEVLLGYLRLRNSAPLNSIILLDEPELHLNPRLARGLPRFYEKHLSRAFGNQIWLVTHSDAILRQAVQEPSYSVFHMQPASQTAARENQLARINATADAERVIIELVGDLASYSPRSKVVLLEGENSETDLKIISQLFPTFSERVNLVSLGSKRKVKVVHELLEKAADNGRIEARFFAIVDRDFSGEDIVPDGRQYAWGVYHIENYLMSFPVVKKVMDDLGLSSPGLTEETIGEMLKDCARQTIKEMVRIKMEQFVNEKLVKSISLKFSPDRENVDGMSEAIERSASRFSVAVEKDLSSEKIREFDETVSAQLKKSLEDGSWVNDFRGRNVIKNFVGRHGKGISYEMFQSLLVAKMREIEYIPVGMQEVVSSILES
ncbi:AAA family ATPase [Paracoccus sp. SSK6]|uniref:ATP-binding protein n=1 Tax=Paracoccus sp. SSK6 TaxID=3143131 RepID=UPI00321A0329